MNIPYAFKKCSKCGEWLVANKINFSKTKRGKWGLKSQCKKCDKEYNKQWRENNKDYRKQHYENNKEYVKKVQKQYRENNKEKIKQYRENNKEYFKEYHKQWRENNEEHYKEYNKQWRENNKEYSKEKNKQWRENNKEYSKEYNKQYYEDNKEHIKKCSRQYYEDNKEHCKEYSKQWYENNQEKFFNYRNKRRQKLENQGRGITDEQWREMFNFFKFRCAYSNECIGGDNNNRTVDHILAIDNGGLNEPWNCVPMYRSYNSSKNKRIDVMNWYLEQEYFDIERLNKIVEWQIYAYEKWGGEEFGELILITDLIEK